MKNSILEKARWLRDVALATSKNNGARVAREWLKYAAMFVMLFTIGSGNVWGASIETFTTTSSGGFSDNSKTIAPITVTMRDGTSNKTSWQTAHVRVYSGGGVTISSSGGNITKIEFTCTANKGSNNGPDKQKLVSGSSGTYSTTNGSAVGVWTPDASGATNIVFNATAQIRFTQIVVTYEPVCSGTQLETPVVTATPSDGQVILTWPNVANASGYQLKWNGGDWVAATSPVTKTGLTNGTSYTYQVKAIGNGSTYCDGDASEEASATPNVYYTVTWKNNGSEYTTTSVASGQKPTFPSNPTSCDGTSTTFYGWSTSEWSGKIDDISAKTIYTSAASMPTVSGAVTYYAVFCKGGGGSEVLNEKFDDKQTTDASSVFSSSTFSNFSGTVSRAYKSQYGGVKFGTSSYAGYITSKSLDLSKAFTVSIDACKYGSDAGNIEVTVGSTTKTISTSSLDAQGSFKTFVLEFDAATSTSTVKIGTSRKRAYIDNVVITTAGTASQYLTTCQACVAPTSVTITGTNKYLGGQTISLTAAPEGGTGEPSYQWQKKISGVWTNLANDGSISGVASNNLQISSCTHANSGGYRCIVSTGDGCETKSHADGTDGYGVHVFSIHGKYTTDADYSDTEIIWTSETTGTATISMDAKKTYLFKVWSNNGNYYGHGANTNEDFMFQPTTWDCGVNNNEMRLFTTVAGNYTFTVNIEHGLDGSPYVNVQVGYPSMTHPNSGYVYVQKFNWQPYLHYWYDNSHPLSTWGSDPQLAANQYTSICGTDYWCVPVIDYYCNFIAKDAAGNPSNTTGDQHTNSPHPGQRLYNDGSWKWGEFSTYTITYAGGDGSTGGPMASHTGLCPGSSQQLTANAFSKAYHTFNGWSDGNGHTYADQAMIENIQSNINLTAQWTPEQYNITATLTNVTSTTSFPVVYTYTGSAAGVTYTFAAADGFRLPDAVTVTGSTYTWDQATGQLTLTGTISGAVSITISGVQTHTVTWMNNGSNYGDPVVYDHGAALVLPASDPSAPSSCSGKVFVGWTSDPEITSETSTEPTIISAGGAVETDATYRAVFATSSANPLAGTLIWDEPFTGFSADDVPTAKSTGATVYNSTELTYACENGGGTTKIYSAYLAGGTSPELLVAKSGGSLTVSNIPTAGQTELTLSYKSNAVLDITSGTGGVMIGDASVERNTYTRTITISQSPAVNNFSLAFTKRTTGNARLDDIHLVVPGSGTMTDYVTLCAPSWTITYDKNTSDPVTNLPSPTSVLQSTGSGTLSATEPTRATYTFGGWATTADGAKVYDAGAEITGVTADKTLYAVWTKTPVEEINLNYFALEKYVVDDAVTLAVTSVVPDGADMSVTWSSSNPSVAPVVAATGVVSFDDVGTATITATSTVTGTTTAVCYVTVRNKPTATFVDLIHNGNGTDLSTYYLQNVAGTSIVFPTLSNTEPGTESCEDQHYIFVGWTTSDNNDDPQDHLVTSDALENDVNKTFYAIWADGVEGSSYTQLTSNSFETAPTKYVIGVNSSGTMYYFNSCAKTGENNSWGYTTKDPTNNPPIQFTLSGTASELVATSTETTARYIVPLTTANFKMSTSSQTLTLNADGTIHNTGDNNAYALRGNSTNLRWYSNNTGNPAYFYKVEAGSAVSYRTSCCADPLAAPSVTATNTAYTVTLTWNAVAGATGYEVSWNNGAWTAATSPVNKTSLTASTTYTYKVRATYNEAVHCGARVASGNVTTDDVYSVTYSGGTGTGSCSPTGSVAAVTYEAGATVTLAATNSFSLTSNTFAAWVVKDAENNDVAVSNNQFTMPASNVTVTATWTAVQDKYYDRMHQSTDASQGGIADGNGKYYIVREGCNYTVPSPADDSTGDTDCHTTHFKLLGWIAQSHLKSDGSIKDGKESHLFQGGTIKSATGATYYAIYAIMTE